MWAEQKINYTYVTWLPQKTVSQHVKGPNKSIINVFVKIRL